MKEQRRPRVGPELPPLAAPEVRIEDEAFRPVFLDQHHACRRSTVGRGRGERNRFGNPQPDLLRVAEPSCELTERVRVGLGFAQRTAELRWGLVTRRREGEHSLGFDPRVHGPGIQKLLPALAVAGNVDREQRLTEACVLGCPQIDRYGPAMDRHAQLLPRQVGGADLGTLRDVSEAQRLRARTEVERSAVEDAVDGAGEGSAVGRDRGEREQAHALQALA